MCTSEHGAGSKTDLKAIAEILEDARLEGRLRSLKLSSDIVRALAQLATQAVAMGIDYKTLGIGWHHPSSRTSYRRGEHRSTRSPASRQRQKASKARLVEALASAADFKLDMRSMLIEEFLREIGVAHEASLRSSSRTHCRWFLSLLSLREVRPPPGPVSCQHWTQNCCCHSALSMNVACCRPCVALHFLKMS